MRQIVMFVTGFAIVAGAGVGIAQTAFFAGDVVPAEADPFVAEPVADLKMTAGDGYQLPPPAKADDDGQPADLVGEPKDSSAKSADSTTLTLDVFSPEDGARVDGTNVPLEGTTNPGAHVWSGTTAATVEPDGSWSMTVPVGDGENVIYVGATLGDQTKTRTRTVHVGQPLVWSITQKVKASESPVEKFYGTGSPGMTITATSPHGSSSTAIPKSGEWWLQIDFTSQPGTSFPVTVTTSTGWAGTYTFSHLGSEKTKTDRDWTINHKYAVNAEPFTKFYGTGPVGTRIVATSQFGSAATEVGKSGEWYLPVWFDVATGATFDVRVTNSLGFDATFPFTYQHSTFEVSQAYGASTEDPPHELFVGRTAPNVWVKAWSEFGSAKVSSNPDGSFEIKVFFENAPFDTPFGVDVIDALGNTKTFSFVRTTAGA